MGKQLQQCRTGSVNDIDFNIIGSQGRLPRGGMFKLVWLSKGRREVGEHPRQREEPLEPWENTACLGTARSQVWLGKIIPWGAWGHKEA